MKKIRAFMWLTVFLVAITSTASSQAPEGLTQDQLSSLAVVKHKLNGTHQLSQSGVITQKQAEEAVNIYLAEANAVAGRQVTLAELASVPDGTISAEPTWVSKAAQRISGWITFVNILYALAAIVGAIAFIIFFGAFIADFLTHVPVVVYEFIAYALAGALIVGGKTWSPEYGLYLGLLGSIIASGCVVFTFKYHFAHLQRNSAVFFGIVTVIFTASALYYSSVLLGVGASIALMGALGFSAAVEPFCYIIGFEDEETLARATTASFLILALFVVLRLTNQSFPALSIFEPGLMFMGSFVGYLGLLIISSRFYDQKGYGYRQVLTIGLGMAALLLGSVLDFPSLLKVGGTFFALYLVEKLFDVISLLKIESAYAISFVGLLIAGALAGAGTLIVQNQEFFSKYLLFL